MARKQILLLTFLIITVDLFCQVKKRVVVYSSTDTILTQWYRMNTDDFLADQKTETFNSILYHDYNLLNYLMNKVDSLFSSENYEVINFISDKYARNRYLFITEKKPLKKTQEYLDFAKDSLKVDIVLAINPEICLVFNGGKRYDLPNGYGIAMDPGFCKYYYHYILQLLVVNPAKKIVFTEITNEMDCKLVMNTNKKDPTLSEKEISIAYGWMKNDLNASFIKFVKRYRYWQKYGEIYKGINDPPEDLL